MRFTGLALVFLLFVPPAFAASPGESGNAHLRSIPRLIPHRSLAFRWSREALEHRSAGLAILHCNLDSEGHTRGCQVERGIAHIRPRELLSYAEGLVFTPAVRWDGTVVELTNFVIPVRLTAPTAERKLPHLPLHLPKP